MHLLTHAAVGGLIGLYSQNPVIGLAGGFASHFLLDAIPHESEEGLFDKPPVEGEDKKRFIRHKLIPMAADLLLLTIFFSYFILNIRVENYLSFMAGITGGLLPDFILSLTLKSRSKIMKKYFDFHHNLHFIIVKRPYVNPFLSAFAQLIITLIAAYFIIYGKF